MDISAINPVADSRSHAQEPARTVPAHEAVQRRQLIQASRSVNDSGILGQNQLVFLIDSQTHRPVIRVENRETHEVVAQIPPEYVLRLAEDLHASAVETMAAEADT